MQMCPISHSLRYSVAFDTVRATKTLVEQAGLGLACVAELQHGGSREEQDLDLGQEIKAW